MRFSIAIPVASLFALGLAAPQTTTAVVSRITSTALSPTQSCLAACGAADVTCQAVCLGTAHPSTADVLKTNQCEARCPQGDGSAADSLKYKDCIQACVASYFPTTETGAPVIGVNTVSPASATVGAPVATNSNGVVETLSTNASPSGTGSAASSTSTGAASSNLNTGAGAIGLAGILMALFAL